MKTILPLRLALFGAVALFIQTSFAQTWQTVLDYQYAAGSTSWIYAMAKDPFGGIYAAGYGLTNNSYLRALITRGTDAGASWSLSDDFVGAFDPTFVAYTGMSSDGAGNLYALGDDYFHWFVRRSQDGGVTWSTVYQAPASAGMVPNAITADSAGNVYVAGRPGWSVLKSANGGNSWATVDAFNPGRSPYAYRMFSHPTLGIFVAGYADGAITTTQGKKTTTTYQRIWYVRRSLNGGATWTTVDSYLIDANAQKFGEPTGITADGSGNLYVVGTIAASLSGSTSYNLHWLVRKSSNGGASWATVDDFFPNVGGTNYNARPEGVAADAFGNVFVAGHIQPVITPTRSGPNQWVVRKLPAGSGTWQTVDNFQYASGRSAIAHGIVADALGNVFVGGNGNDATGVNGSAHWLVRKVVP